MHFIMVTILPFIVLFSLNKIIHRKLCEVNIIKGTVRGKHH